MICDYCLNNHGQHRLPVWLDESTPAQLRLEYSMICNQCRVRIVSSMAGARDLIRAEYARMYRPEQIGASDDK